MPRNFMFAIIGVVLALAFFEGASAFYFKIKHGQFPYSTAERLPDETFNLASAIFQPYLGYILRPGREGKFLNDTRWQANNHGFHNLLTTDGKSCCDYPYNRRGDEIIIGVFGGSVGSGFGLAAQISNSFQSLANDHRFTGNQVRVLNFSLPGFKQPQQLMTLAYFLNLGQQFDIIINIDGFNEAVTSWKNWSEGADPTYPADSLWGAWGRHIEGFSKSTENKKDRSLADFNDAAAQIAQRSSNESSIASLKLFFLAKARWHQWRSSSLREKDQSAQNNANYFLTSPRSPIPEGQTIWSHTALAWERASLSMAALANDVGAQYIHILQPNQWDIATGTYSPIDPEHIYDWVVGPVNKTYPLFRTNGQKLTAANVDFLDLSSVFKSEDGSKVYVDDCCHYTLEGYEIIFDRVIQSLLKDPKPVKP